MISNFISSNVKNTRMILHIDIIISYIKSHFHIGKL